MAQALRIRRAVAAAASTPLRRAVIFSGALIVLMVAWLVAGWGGENVAEGMDLTVETIAPAFAATGALLAARRRRGGERAAWTLLGLSAVSWAIGSAIWEFLALNTGNDMPYPSAADAGFLAALPLAAAALLLFSPHRAADRVRHLLDGLLIAGAVMSVTWGWLFTPLFARGVDLRTLVSVAYPLSDMVLFALAIVLLPEAAGRARAAVAWICVGVLANAVADSSFSYITATSGATDTPLPDVLWVAGYCALGIAGRVPQRGEASWKLRQRLGTLSALLPYLAVAAAIAVGVDSRLRGEALTPSRFWSGVAVLLLVMVRQGVALWDNVWLARRLEHKVEERTRELAARERRFRALVQRSADSISVVDGEGIVIYQSPAVEPMLGYAPDDLHGGSLAAIADGEDGTKLLSALVDLRRHPGRTTTLELRVRHRDGARLHCETTMTNLLADPDVAGTVVNMRDVTERRRLEDELSHQALHDRLTGLPNRVLFHDRLVHAIESGTRSGRPTTVLFVDLDGFKRVNDTRGHTDGDMVLVTAARRIGETLRPSDTVARLGGDEFVVALEGAAKEDGLSVAERIVSAMRLPVHLADGDVMLSASVGAASCEAGESPDPELLVRNADVAMYLAKGKGRDRVQVYDPEVHFELLDDMRLQSDLRGVVERGELRVVYQPVVLLAGGEPVGMEALLRWDHPTRGPVSPATFVPLAERAGLMRPIGRWVLREGCSRAAAWLREMPGTTLQWVSVNVSADQLVDDSLADEVLEALRISGLDPHRLVLELTESALVHDARRVAAMLTRLRDLGVRIAIDDFGTGYSSLSYLDHFPVDILKVDRSFVEGTTPTGQLSVLARTIVDLSHNLHVVAIAEGLERVEQMRSFMARRCEMGQGFLFARPMCDGEVRAYLSGFHAQAAVAGRERELG